DMMTGIAFISSPDNIAKMNKELPVFFISGDLDPVGENGKGPAKAYAAFKSAGMHDVSIRFYKNCRHELLNELNKEEVLKDVLSWLETRLPGE
ncbi:MAG: alpha/beta hydrolase, partial [Oscillospiraceae bacterium]|nr:alpha/beta hydrolase [Oscillospiraceae bacterium]